MSGVDPNGGGALVIPSGGGLPSGGTVDDLLLGDETWTPISDAVSTGLTSILGADPAGTAIVGDGAGDVTTVVLPVWVPVSLASGNGWTVSESAGTDVTVSASDVPVVISIPSTAGAYPLAYATRTPPVTGEFEVRARLRVHSGGTTSLDVGQITLRGPSGTNSVGINIRGDDTVVSFTETGAGTAVSVPGIRDGEGWALMRVRAGGVQMLVGIGADGDPPTAYTSLGGWGRAAYFIGYTEELRLSANRGNTPHTGDLSVTWGDLSYRRIDP